VILVHALNLIKRRLTPVVMPSGLRQLDHHDLGWSSCKWKHQKCCEANHHFFNLREKWNAATPVWSAQDSASSGAGRRVESLYRQIAAMSRWLHWSKDTSTPSPCFVRLALAIR